MKYEKILATLDGSPLAEAVLPHVEEIGRCCEAELVLLRVMDKRDAIPWGFGGGEGRSYVEAHRQKVLAELNSYVEEKVSVLVEAGLKARSRVEVGKVAETILSVADDEDADLIAMATHGWSGLSRWVYGSTADRVMRAATRPMLLVRSEEMV